MSLQDTQFDADGFIADPNKWNRELAESIAARNGVSSLGNEHWQLIEELRRHYRETGSVPVMRHVCKDAGLQEHCVSDLLADPRLAWRIAGLPNPGEEANAYLESAEIAD